MAKIDMALEFSSRFNDELEAIVSTRARRALSSVGRFLKMRIKDKLSHPGSGRWYRSKLGYGKHQASAPGEPPAPDRGVYRDSWFYRTQARRGQFEVRIGTPLWTVFGRRLELGGVSTSDSGDSVYIAPRPHVRAVFEEERAKIQMMLDNLEDSGGDEDE